MHQFMWGMGVFMNGEPLLMVSRLNTALLGGTIGKSEVQEPTL